ncbi:hypothetical protein M0R45_023370 [Rubus argutus]|uniref:Uncharacterized protein n=1 Tax=Rubus argutus TaxID=59490 RepID=A0AAW1WMR4_RUBAR
MVPTATHQACNHATTTMTDIIRASALLLPFQFHHHSITMATPPFFLSVPFNFTKSPICKFTDPSSNHRAHAPNPHRHLCVLSHTATPSPHCHLAAVHR